MAGEGKRRIDASSPTIEWEPRLVEEALGHALRARPEGRLFYPERERIERATAPDDRARALRAHDREWFARLGLDTPVARALGEQPAVADGIARCVVERAGCRRDAGAELVVRPRGPWAPPAAGRLVRIRLEPDMLLVPARLLGFIRRAIQRVADLLDPRFGRAPWTGTPAARAAYRVVWDVTVDGRLMRRGLLPRTVRAARRREFLAAFRGLGPQAVLAFTRFFIDPAPTHAALLEFVDRAAGVTGRLHCPVCGRATAALGAVTGLAGAIVAEIAADHPGWRVEDGCCPACEEAYCDRSRWLRVPLSGVA
jgi:hypothetical protein